MRAIEVMTPTPNCCLRSTSVRMAAMLMRQFGLGMLPVVNNCNGRKLVGVVTDRDICVRVIGTDKLADATLVEDCMTPDPACCRPDTDVAQVLALMITRRVHRIPVVDGRGKLLGIVSIDDLIRHGALDTWQLCDAIRQITAPAQRHRAATA